MTLQLNDICNAKFSTLSKKLAWQESRIFKVHQSKLSRLSEPAYHPYLQAIESIPDSIQTNHIDVTNDFVEIGKASDISSDEKELLYKSLESFIPWKKGPFNIFGIQIDSEWRCELKWNRLKDVLKETPQNSNIADIGCNNGYYLYRLLNLNPHYVLGIDPVLRQYLTFKLLQKFHPTPELDFKLLGIEHMDLFPKTFDTVLCLGILYHHTDPVGLVKKIFSSLKTGGRIIIDCMGIEGVDPISLHPKGRYTNCTGFWQLPTASCIENWLHRSGYRNIFTFFSEPLTTHEQRSTLWAPIPSLKDFLDPNNSKLTIEGYPAPWRHYLVATR